MKSIFSIITLLLLAAAPSSQGQGQVWFNNYVPGPFGVIAPVYGLHPTDPQLRLVGNSTTNGGTVNYTGCPLLLGTTFSAELLAGLDANNLNISYATVQFRTRDTMAGFITPPSPLPASLPYTILTGRMRAWDNGGDINSTYADALAANRPSGYSDTFLLMPDVPPGTPPALRGLTSFNLTLVPEPSMLMLGAFAGAALLWRRRVGRKS